MGQHRITQPVRVRLLFLFDTRRDGISGARRGSRPCAVSGDRMPGPNQEDGDVSKRPKTATGVMSRLRRPADRLRDLPIWSKLGLIMLVPTLATIIVGVSGLVDHINEANNAERARTLSVLSQAAGGLVDRLQNERSYAVIVKTIPANAPEHKKAQDIYKAEWANVDAA